MIKSRSAIDATTQQQAYWRTKTPEERLRAAQRLLEWAKAIYKANPNNPPLTDNGARIYKSDKPIQRRRFTDE